LSFYHRWGQTNPVQISDPYYYLSGCFIIARYTEGFQDNTMGDRFIGVWVCPANKKPSYFVATYDLATNTTTNSKTIEIGFDDFDGSWNFIHVGYSME
jgi:hypothetical protein